MDRGAQVSEQRCEYTGATEPAFDCGDCTRLEDCPLGSDLCPECLGELVWVTEYSSAQPSGTDYEVRECEDCHKATGERQLVGH